MQFVGALLLFLAALKEKETLDSIALASLAFGGFGLVFGSIGSFQSTHMLDFPFSCAYYPLEMILLQFLGLKRSRAGFLKFYMLASSVATVLSLLSVATGNLTLEVCISCSVVAE